MKRSFLAFLFLLPYLAFSQPVIINGYAPGAEGKTIRLSCPADLLTNIEKELARASIGADGRFELKCDLKEITPATLSIGFHNASLFIEPGMGYEISFARIDDNSIPDENPLLRSQDLHLKFNNAEKDELNNVLQHLNSIYDNFLLKSYNALLRDRNRQMIDTFRNEVKREIPLPRSPYIEDCIRYKIASLELLAQAKSQAQFAKTYFSDSPVLYRNPDYMDIFNQFFSKYFWVTSRVLKFKDYNTIIKDPDSYAKMMKTLAEDTLLKKPQLREMVMIKGLGELFYQQGYNQEAILILLKAISEKSNFPVNREVASDMISLLNHLRPGAPSPDFSLLAMDEKKMSLKDFRGKPVLISFWATWCEPCLNDMEVMADLYKKYKDRMYFVSLSADREFVKMKYFISMKKEFSWVFLHLDEDIDVMKAFDIKSFPSYILLDARGNIVSCPADPPSSGLEQQLEKLNNP